MVRLIVVLACLVAIDGSARADDLDQLRREVEQVIVEGHPEQIDDHIELAMRRASMANAPVRLGRIELFAAELDAERPTVKTAERARKAMLHLGTDPAVRLAELRWHVSGAQAALAAGKLGGAALHIQGGRAALARLHGGAGKVEAKAAAGAAVAGSPPVDPPPRGTTEPRRDRVRLDDTERSLLAQLRRAVEQQAENGLALPAGHRAALAAYANGELLKADASGNEPLPPRSRPAGDGLLGKLDRALVVAEEREIAAAEARGDGQLVAAARVRHAETLLRIGRTAEAVAVRRQSLAWYRDSGTLDQVVRDARWIADRAERNPRAVFAARRESVRELERGLGKLVGPLRGAATTKHRGELVALVEAAAAVAALPGQRGGLELLEAVDLARDRSVWDQVALFTDGDRWKRLGGAGSEVARMLEAIAREDVSHGLDTLSIVDNLASPASRARQKASDAMARGGATPSDPPAPDAAAITARLAGRTLVVYCRLDTARLAIGVLPAKSSAKLLILRLSSDEETQLVAALRAGLREGADRWHEPARLLHAQLVAPVESLLGPSAVVIPDATLAALPFAALESGTGQLLAETMAITFSPSLLALSAPRTEAFTPRSSLIYGVPRFAEQGVRPLPWADREAGAVKAVLTAAGRNPRQLPAATSAAQLGAEVGRYDVFHVASRVRLDGEMPVVGALLTATAPLFAFDLSRIGLRANLLVLDTAMSVTELPPAVAARGLAGIVGGALAWPARSLVVAVQGSEGAAGAALFARMYERYVGGESPSEALAGAQRDMAGGKLEQPLLLAAGADPIVDSNRFVHPRFWAGYAAWGEP